MTAILFGIGKWLLGLYLGTRLTGSAYGPASSLITLLLWVYYSSQILLLGAEFTQVYADRAGREVKPDEGHSASEKKKSKSVESWPCLIVLRAVGLQSIQSASLDEHSSGKEKLWEPFY